MPRQAVALTELRIRNTKPVEREQRLYDGNGLYLSVMPSGARWWRVKYVFEGKERRAGIGSYPEVSLQQVRAERDRIRARLREGRDPIAEKREARSAVQRAQEVAFEIVAQRWLARKLKGARGKGWAPETYRKASYVVDAYLTPALRSQSIAILSTQTAAKVIEEIAEHAPNLAAKARQYLGGIVDFAIKKGLREDGRLLSLRGTVPHYQKGHIPAAIELRSARRSSLPSSTAPQVPAMPRSTACASWHVRTGRNSTPCSTPPNGSRPSASIHWTARSRH